MYMQHDEDTEGRLSIEDGYAGGVRGMRTETVEYIPAAQTASGQPVPHVAPMALLEMPERAKCMVELRQGRQGLAHWPAGSVRWTEGWWVLADRGGRKQGVRYGESSCHRWAA